MSDDNSEPLRRMLRTIPAKLMVEELCARGAFKVLEQSLYMPGIVIARYGKIDDRNPALVQATAKLIRDFTHSLLNENVLSIEHAPATERQPHAPPNDLIVTCSLMVPNPTYEDLIDPEDDFYAR